MDNLCKIDQIMVLFARASRENSNSSICLVAVAILGMVEVVLLISAIVNILLVICEFIIIILMIKTGTGTFSSRSITNVLNRHTSCYFKPQCYKSHKVY